MGDKTKIEWTNATWNPTRGCSRASEGCRNCYAERVAARFSGPGMPYEGLIHPSTKGWNGQVRLVPEVLTRPIRWQKPRMIFVNSTSDLFHDSLLDEQIDAVFGVMWACLYTRHEQPGHIFQILTKRPERMRDYLSIDRRHAWAAAAVNYGVGLDPDGLYDQIATYEGPHPRIWLGVSVEDQAAADERIPFLLQCQAAVRWLSCEPLIGPIAFRWASYAHQASGQTYREYLDQHRSVNEYEALRQLDWIVAGGESGPGARPMHADWARSLREQCANVGVPFFFKQWGEWAPAVSGMWFYMLGEDCAPFAPRAAGKNTHDFGNGIGAVRLGKKRAGRLLDGTLHNAYPEVTHV